VFLVLFGVDSTLITNSTCRGGGIGMLLEWSWVLVMLLILSGFPLLFNLMLITNSTCQGCGIGVLLRIVWVLAVLLVLDVFPILFGVDSMLKSQCQQHLSRLWDKCASPKLALTTPVDSRLWDRRASPNDLSLGHVAHSKWVSCSLQFDSYN